MRLDLTATERSALRAAKLRKADLPGSPEELQLRSGIPPERCRELVALATFQRIRSLGYEFARDLLFLGHYSLAPLAELTGAALYDRFERKKGYWTDPCVEDQFRRVVHFAQTGDNTLSWFDFTAERKRYRREKGYPEDRPRIPWYEVVPVRGRGYRP